MVLADGAVAFEVPIAVSFFWCSSWLSKEGGKYQKQGFSVRWYVLGGADHYHVAKKGTSSVTVARAVDEGGRGPDATGVVLYFLRFTMH